jgi:hypothetical protein
VKMAAFDEALKESVKRLARALAKLDDTQGPRGRRISRNRVTRALGQVKEAMDVRFPAPPRKVVIRSTGNLTPNQRVAKLKREGYVAANSVMVEMAAVAGVRVKTVEIEDGSDGVDKLTMLPSWAAAAPNASAMKALKATRGKARKGLLVDISLKKRNAPGTF